MTYIKVSQYNNEIVDKYLNKAYTIKMLANEYGCNISTIGRLLKRNNITKRLNSKYSFNEDYFEVINDEHKAYWLGFMYADGYVSSTDNDILLRLKHDDGYILEELVKDLNSNIPIRYYIGDIVLPQNKIRKSTHYYACFNICNAKLKHDLIKHGCLERKSLVLKFPTTVPNKLLPHFIRGYMDGDGCITNAGKSKNGFQNYKVSFCGTKEMLESIKDLFGYNNKLYKRHKDNKNNYSLDIGGNVKVLDLLDTLYKDSTIHLKRKHDRYLEIKQTAPSISNDTGNNHVNCGNTLRALRANQSRKLRLWEE